MLLRKTLLFILFTCNSTWCFCQANNVLKSVVSSVNTSRINFPIEKVYVQTDKPYYTLGDTLHFKAYLLNADFLTPSVRSGLLYVELDDATSRVMKRIMVPLASGLSWSNIAIDETEIPEGSYTLRAYTNWMRNFGDDYIFKKDIYVSALSGSTLVSAAFKLDSTAGKTKVQASLGFTNLNKEPIRLTYMQLKVMNGRHNLFKDKATTGIDGTMQLNFDLADETAIKNLYINARQTGKGADTANLNIPVIVNRPQKTDLQFMPEGGNLVTGLPARVGFKAIGEDGKGVNITGRVINSHQQEVVKFQPVHNGMGSFELTPQAGESYTAIINLPDKTTKSYALPAIDQAGTTLRIGSNGADSLEVTISNTAVNGIYYLIGQARGVVCYAAAIRFKETTVKKIIATALFPTGIARFTLINVAQLPLNERIVYINHNDNLNISINSAKPNYGLRDSIALVINVKDKDGKPIQGAFSLAVTDNGQVTTDSLGNNIVNDLLFTSDLKGTVEEPGWYFENNTSERITALDDLLLTQGWVGYGWKQVLNAKLSEPAFRAEPEFVVEGKVTNVLNKPVIGSGVVLFSKSPLLVRDTVTDKEGHFIFKGIFPVDTAVFKLQARNKKGKEFNVGIEMLHEFKPPVFSSTGAVIPWYVNSDTLLLNNSNTKLAQLKAEENLRGEGVLLKEVTIKDKKVVKGSKNLNGPGEADQVLDEKDMLKAGKMSLSELLEKQVKGFRIPGFYKKRPWYYLLNDKPIRFIFDGFDLEEFYDETDKVAQDYRRYLYLKAYFDYFTAEDIKGIEVMYGTSYTSTYALSYTGPVAKQDIAFIEITTRSGNGRLMKYTPGTYLYKPLPFTLPKQFYRPRYTVKNVNLAFGTDLRSTIHWEPNITTDTAGNAIVSFFSADKPTDYTITIEGIDDYGNIGYKRKKITVSPKVNNISR